MPRTLRLLTFENRVRLLWVAAWLWRRLLVRTTFIAITGSVGKTTTKECLATVLSARFRVAKTLRNQNDRYGLPRSILRVRPWHEVAVLELATSEPGQMRRKARLTRPDVAVVVTVARTHVRAFAALEDTAAEKAELVKALRPSGLAVLNADDPLVRAMADVCRGRVMTFGRGRECDIVAEEIPSAWPARLAMDVDDRGTRTHVRTQLVGSHWFHAVVAAIAAASACRVAPPDAARVLAEVVPFPGRLQPVLLPGGAVVLRDEAGNTLPSIDAALQVLASAVASRKILVIGGAPEWPMSSRQRTRTLGSRAAGVADVAVFVHREHGQLATRAARAAGMPEGHVHAFGDVRAAAEFLRSELRAGDLVLLKGRTTEHLSRIAFAQFGEVGCWTETCRKLIMCDFCPQLRAAHPSLPVLPPVAAAGSAAEQEATEARRQRLVNAEIAEGTQRADRLTRGARRTGGGAACRPGGAPRE